MQRILLRPEMRGIALAVSGALIFGMLLIAGPSLARADTSVSIADNSFSPQSISVAPGDTVTWTNNGSMNHTVTADDGSFTSGTLTPGATYSHTFMTAGSFPYYCQFHGGPGGVGMSGTVVVDASLSSASSSSTTSTSTTDTTSTSTTATSTPAAPVLSNGNVVPNDTGAIISWTTDINSDAQVSYGPTATYTSTTSSDGVSSTNHSVTIAGLMPGTLYHFMAMSSTNGVMGMSPDETFTTTNTMSSSTGSTSTTTTSTSTTSTPPPGTNSSIEDRVASLEAEVKALEQALQAFLSQNGDHGSTGGDMTSSVDTAVYAAQYAVLPGGTIHFNGSGFGPNEKVSISANGATISTATTDAHGDFTASDTASNTSGDTTYWFTGQNSGNKDSVMITTLSGANS